jgi:hypothetical protein
LIPAEAAAYQITTATGKATPAGRRPGAGDILDGSRLQRRIAAYMATLPNLSKGQGRPKVAYTFAAFLARDLQLPDDVVLAWLECWDSANAPPLGRDGLMESVACARRYGRHEFGAGLRGGSW